MRRRPQGERGIALITAVLVVSLAVIAASAVLVAASLAIHRTSAVLESERAWWYATGVEAWVKTILQRDARENSIDALDDIWAQPVDVLPVEQGFLSGQIVDLQGRFNLNNFAVDAAALPAYLRCFERLFEELGLDPFLAKPIAQAIRDWTDKDQNVTPHDGAEDTEYLQLQPPYRTPDRLMTSVSELMAIKGVTRDIYLRLLPHVTVLPAVGSPINVNTATAAVLHALANKPNAELEAFLRERIEKPAESTQELTQNGAIGAQDPGKDMLAVASSFFQLRGVATIANSRVAIYSLYYRPPQGLPLVLSRSTDSD